MPGEVTREGGCPDQKPRTRIGGCAGVPVKAGARREQGEPPTPPDGEGGVAELDELIRLAARPRPAPPKPKAARFPVSVIGVLFVLVFGYGLIRFAAAYGVGYERSRLAARAEMNGRRLDTEMIKRLTGTATDTDTPAFRSVVEQLARVRAENADCRFVYLMGWKDGAVIFLADGTDPLSPDYSAPGEAYDEASADLIRSFAVGDPFVEGPTVDRWGTWVSGLYPIRDPSTRRVLGVFGMDVNAARWRITQWIARILAALGTVLLAGVMVLFARRVRG